MDGNALESMRIIVFHQALQDISAMKLAESFVGKEKVVEAIENAFGESVEFDVCARSTEQMQAVRDAVNDIIKKNIG
jgi:ribosomal protein L1